MRKNWIEMQTPKGPGYTVSVDQLVSHITGLISQKTGIMKERRYKYATLYVDQ